MFRKFKIAIISALLGLGTLAGMPANAQADSIYFSFGGNGARAGVHIGEHPRYHKRKGHRRHYQHRHRQQPRWARSCSPRDAVRKAYRMGLDHVRITRADHRIIRVTGHKYRHRASIIFARAPNCPVIRYS